MSAEIAKLDLLTIKAFQLELHQGSKTNPQEEVLTQFGHEFRKKTWSTSVPVTIPGSLAEGKITFTMPMAFHYLQYVVLRQKLPAIRVLPQFSEQIRICWPHNPGSNVVPHAVFKINEDTVQTLTAPSYDALNQFELQPAGFRNHYDLCIGNRPFLEEWAELLPEYTTNFIVPWGFSRHESQAIPLLLCSMDKITMTFTVRNKLTEMLRMQQKSKKTGEWIDIPPRPQVIEGCGTNLPVPELSGRFSLISDEELNYHRHGWNVPDPIAKAQWENLHTYYTRNFIPVKSPNPLPFGKTEELGIICNTPCLKLYWMGENVSAQKMNNYSNYTSNTKNLYDGYNVCGTTTLSHSGQSRIKDLNVDFFDKIEPWKTCKSAPTEAGYNTYSFSNDSMGLDAEVGLIFKGLDAKFSVQLENSNPFLKPIDTKNNSSNPLEEIVDDDEIPVVAPTHNRPDEPTFTIHLLLLVLRKLTFQPLDPIKGTFKYILDNGVEI